MLPFSRRLSALTIRQAVALLVMFGLAVGAVVSAATDNAASAAGFVAVMLLMQFLAVLQLRRRFERSAGKVRELQYAVGSLTLPDAKDMARLEFAINRTLASVETERLSAAERQQALLKLLDTSERQPTG